MTKTDYVTHCIRHHEDFPDVEEIDLLTARSALDNVVPSPSIPSITPEEYVELWNSLIRDPAVMSID